MNGTKKLSLSAAVLLLAALVPKSARADTINLSLAMATQTVVQGTTTVEFDATASNPSMTDTVYLNAAGSPSTNSLAVTVDLSPFTGMSSVWPFFLAPSGQSGDSFGPSALFFVDLAANIAPGMYTGSFSILGGPDNGAGTAFDDLADVNFTVNVTAPLVTPEPASLLLLSSGLTALCLLRKNPRPWR